MKEKKKECMQMILSGEFHLHIKGLVSLSFFSSFPCFLKKSLGLTKEKYYCHRVIHYSSEIHIGKGNLNYYFSLRDKDLNERASMCMYVYRSVIVYRGKKKDLL